MTQLKSGSLEVLLCGGRGYEVVLERQAETGWFFSSMTEFWMPGILYFSWWTEAMQPLPLFASPSSSQSYLRFHTLPALFTSISQPAQKTFCHAPFSAWARFPFHSAAGSFWTSVSDLLPFGQVAWHQQSLFCLAETWKCQRKHFLWCLCFVWWFCILMPCMVSSRIKGWHATDLHLRWINKPTLGPDTTCCLQWTWFNQKCKQLCMGLNPPNAEGKAGVGEAFVRKNMHVERKGCLTHPMPTFSYFWMLPTAAARSCVINCHACFCSWNRLLGGWVCILQGKTDMKVQSEAPLPTNSSVFPGSQAKDILITFLFLYLVGF